MTYKIQNEHASQPDDFFKKMIVLDYYNLTYEDY